MSDKERDQYLVLFGGARLSKREANKAGLGLAFGFAGVIVSLFSFGSSAKVLAVIVMILFAGFGYFFLGNRLFKK